MIYYIADTHLDDERIMRLSRRPFKDISEMNNTIIINWNSRVKDKDIVYILGDFALNGKSASKISLLNGVKRLILGNHDKVLSNETLALFDSVNSILTIEDEGRSVALCHYPLLSFENSIYGGYQVFGHIHNNEKDIAFKLKNELPRSFNVSADVIDFTPRTLNELIDMKEKKLI